MFGCSGPNYSVVGLKDCQNVGFLTSKFVKNLVLTSKSDQKVWLWDRKIVKILVLRSKCVKILMFSCSGSNYSVVRLKGCQNVGFLT